MDASTYVPVILRPHIQGDNDRLLELLEHGAQVHDDIVSQVSELVKTLHPERQYTKDELAAAALEHLGARDHLTYGVWVYYPWGHRLVHLLDEPEFALVRTDRNRNKITSEEQAALATKKVGVIGLSVGQSVSLTLALERSFGEIRLADFDTLELSNLNRIRSGVHEMGVLKVINAAREIAEIDPFLKVTIFPEGITKANMDRFFSEGGDLDLLIEECDSVDVKILVRQKAKALRIPVVMDMSDRGCMDVERFDLEPERPLMHGWIDHLDLEAAGRPMTNEEKIPYMLPIVGTETLSTRMKASMIEMGETVGTWPQLASSVTLGGAMTADVHRRIMLDQFRASGRWYVDLDEAIGPTLSKNVDKVDTVTPIPTDFISSAKAATRSLPAPGSVIGEDDARSLAHAAALAPSAGNVQPWYFVHLNGRLVVILDSVRAASRWDPDHLMAHIAIGTCLENIRLKALELGFQVDCTTADDPSGTAIVVERRAGMTKVEDPDMRLFPWIAQRCSNRKVVAPQPLGGAAEALRSVVQKVEGCDLLLFEDRPSLDRLAELCSRSEKVRLLDRIGHHEFFDNEVRWTPEEAERTRDGLDLATMEMTVGQMAALRIAADPAAMALVNEWEGGKALQRFSRKGIQNASAVAAVLVNDLSLPSRLQGAQAGQRMWMEANRLGWAVHPISAPIFLTHAVNFLPSLATNLRTELDEVRTELDSCFPGPMKPLFMVRLSPASQPSARSLRLPLEELFTIVRNHLP